MQTAENILAIKTWESKTLFPGDEKAVKTAFKRMAKKWHPDANEDADADRVFRHLIILRDSALKQVKMPEMKSNEAVQDRFVIKKADGCNMTMRQLRLHKGDLGNIIVGQNSIAYEFSADWMDIAQAEEVRTQGFPFADKAMHDEFARFLARFDRRIDTMDGAILVYRRPKDTVLLSDLVSHMGRIPPVHAAWIISSMYNIACYNEWAGLVHGAICQNNLLVNPEGHSLTLVGGWGYATKIGERPTALPQRTLDLMPRLAIKGQTITTATDLELIKLTAQEILGAGRGGGIHLQKDVPTPMAEWLSAPSGSDAFDEYEAWSKALDEAFGPRRFVKMGITPNDIYN